MSYRPHRSHVRYAPVAAPSATPRRRAFRGAALAAPVSSRGPSQLFTGILFAMPASLLLWGGLAVAARALF